MDNSKSYWFPAKRYGWGWGMPTVWQGKLALGLFFVLVGIGAITLLPIHGPAAFVIYCAVLCLVLMLVCWVKGEPPKWRWDKE